MLSERTKQRRGKDRNLNIDADELRKILKPIHDKLVKAGVPEERLPGNDAIVSMLMKWIDRDKIDTWVETYATAMGK